MLAFLSDSGLAFGICLAFFKHCFAFFVILFAFIWHLFGMFLAFLWYFFAFGIFLACFFICHFFSSFWHIFCIWHFFCIWQLLRIFFAFFGDLAVLGMCLVFFWGAFSWWRHPNLWLVVTREPCWAKMSKNAHKFQKMPWAIPNAKKMPKRDGPNCMPAANAAPYQQPEAKQKALVAKPKAPK